MATTMINVRLDDALKTEAEQVLAKYNMGPTQAVRALFSRIVEEQKLPSFMEVKTTTEDEEIARKRAALKELVEFGKKFKNKDIPDDETLRKMRTEYLMKKHGGPAHESVA